MRAYLGNSRYHFVTRISKHTDNQERAHSVSGNDFWKVQNRADTKSAMNDRTEVFQNSPANHDRKSNVF